LTQQVRDVRTRLRYEIEGVEAAAQSPLEVAKGFRELNKELDRATPAASKFTSSMEGVSDEARIFDQSTRSMLQSVEDMDREFFSIPRSVDAFNASIEQSEHQELEAAQAAQERTQALLEEEAAQRRAGAALEQTLPNLTQYRQSLDELTDVERRRREQLLNPARGGRSSLDTVDRAGAIGSQIFSGLGAGEAANAAGLVGDISGALTVFGPAAAAVTATLGIGTAAFNVYNSQLQANIERAGTFADAITEALQAGTDAQIQELIRRDEAAIRIAEANRTILQDRAEEARAQAAQTLDNASTDIRNFLESTADSLFGTETQALARDTAISAEAYNSQIEDQNRLIDEARVRLDAYNLILGENVAVTGQLVGSGHLSAAAAREQAQAVKDAALAVRDHFQEMLQGGLESVRDLTGGIQDFLEGVRDRALDLVFGQQNEAKAFQVKQAELAAQAEAELAATRDQASEKIKQLALAEAERSLAAQELAQQGLTDAVDNLFDANTDVLTATQHLEKAQAALAESADSSAEKIQSINAESEDKRGKALEKALDAREDAERDHLQEVAEIERREFLSLKGAVRDRNVVAAIQAKERETEELRKEKQADEKRLETIKDGLQDQQQAIADNARRALQTVERQARDEQAIKQRAVDQARVELLNAENAQSTLEKQVHVAQQNANAAHYTALLGVHDKGMTAILNLVAAKYNQAMVRTAGTGSKGFNSPNITPFAFAGQTQQASGKSLTFNIAGQSRLAVQRQINLTMRQIWED
jgi:hypothetical protein